MYFLKVHDARRLARHRVIARSPQATKQSMLNRRDCRARKKPRARNDTLGEIAMKKRFAGILLIACFVSFQPAQAAVPKLMTYQGLLKNGSGSFLTGNYSMTFRIYSASAGGTSLWTETQPSVSASSGKFSVQLGSVTALNLDFNADYWLSIQVGADSEMSPRVRLTSMGYGVRADYETNGFTQSQHDALSHENIKGVKDNSVNIAKTNFKIDAYTLAKANNMTNLLVDSLNDSTGIDSALSIGYAQRVSPYYDVVVTPGGIDSNAKLVLHANGTNGSTIFSDSSSGAKTVTTNGNAQITTAQSKFGGASGLFDGRGDYLSAPSASGFSFGSDDFTVDFWVRFNSISNCTLVNLNDTYYYNLLIWLGSGNVLKAADGNGNFLISGTTVPTTNTWYHIAFVRSGNTQKLYVNGASEGTPGSYSGSMGSSTTTNTFGSDSSGAALNGWMDEIRISKGVARWTSNFTPPASEYTTPASTATIISTVYPQTSVPTEAIVIADETLGTGTITYYVSRDNGITWTSCAKETVTNISTQPSGTQLRWKAVITGNAALNAIAVSV